MILLVTKDLFLISEKILSLMVSSNNIDKIAEDILEEYYPEMLQAPMALPIYDFARNIGGEVEERTLPQ